MASSPDCTAPARAAPPFYNLAWRWHFYAGLFVIPFMILLSITGIIYLFKPQLDTWMYADLMQVSVAEQRLSADQQLAIVREAYPQAVVSKYLPPAAQDRSAQFVINRDGQELNLFVDPYNDSVLGTQDALWNLQTVVRKLHGDLLIGTVGDRLIELTAGWGIVLVVSGLYLWWPRGSGGAGVLWPRLSAGGRLRQVVRPGQPTADGGGVPADHLQLRQWPGAVVETPPGRTLRCAAAAPRPAALEDRHRRDDRARCDLPAGRRFATAGLRS